VVLVFGRNRDREQAEHRNGRGWVTRLALLVRPEWPSIVASFVAAILGAALAACIPLVERQIIDRVILHAASPLWPWLAILLVMGFGTFALSRTRRLRSATVVLRAQSRLRDQIHNRLQRLDAGSREVIPVGQLIARANSDVSRLIRMLSPLPVMTAYAAAIVTSLALMFLLSPLLALVQLLVIPAIVAVAFRMRASVVPASWDGQQRSAELAQRVHRAISGVQVVKGFGQEQYEIDRMAEVAAGLYGSRLRTIRLTARFRPLLFAIPSIGQVAVLAGGGWMALHHELSVGTFLAFSTYAIELTVPSWLVGGMLASLPQIRSSADRIFDLIDTTSEIEDDPSAPPLRVPRGGVLFDNVSFRYPAAGRAVRNFHLRIAPGETVALVGPSGAGKSTVAMLLARFRDPDAGAVLVDDVDIRDVSLDSLRRRIGMVFQDTFLFADTVRANIAYGRPDASAQEVEAAARAAQLHDFILSLPDGYDTILTEQGVTLSGGQRQRLALARALLMDPPILILDDTTSAVDAQVEWDIQQALRDVLPGRTALVVAHRRATLALADRIAVMAEGTIVDVGTHDELMVRCPLYNAMLARVSEQGLLRPGTPMPDEEWPAADNTAPATPRMVRRSIEMQNRVARLPPIRETPKYGHALKAEDKSVFSTRRFLRPYRRSLLLGGLLVLVNAAAVAAGPYLSRQAVDSVVIGGAGDALLPISVLYLVVTVISCVVVSVVGYVTGRTGEQLMFDLRIRVWRHLQRLPLEFYDREPAGAVMTRMTTDVQAFSSLFQEGIINAVVSALSCVAIAVAMLWLSPLLTLTALASLLPLAAATVAFRRLSARPYAESREAVAAVNSGLQESLAGARESQAFGQVERRHRQFRQLTKRYLDSRLAAQRLITLYFPFIDFLSSATTVTVLGVGFVLVRNGSLSAGGLVAFLLYVGMFFSPMQQLSEVIDDWQEAQVSRRKITELMRLHAATPADRVSPSRPRSSTAGRPTWGTLPASLFLQDVRFRYPSRTDGDALRGVTFSVAPGETVSLVGTTGAGKSTIVKLLAGLRPASAGLVLVNGCPLDEWDPVTYHSRLGYVPQEPFLFPDTIHANIAYGRPDATPEDVEAAARAVGAHDVIAALPGGYSRRVSERGDSLSAGQRQLICLARAELLNPAVLLLDEATASLDPVSEAMVTAAMGAMAGRRTTVLVAHRLETARLADRIIVMHHGRVVEAGPHAELLANGMHYARLWAYATADGRTG
jgi:ATP-binding cassette subfamily B protein